MILFLMHTDKYHAILPYSHHSKVVLTSNEMPNIKMDTGIASRIVSYHHVSHFTDDEKMVDHSKHVYLKDKDLLSTLIDNEQLKMQS